jgi:hypothetical protein
MNCHEVTNQLTAYLDDELSPSERKLVQAHLAICKSCQQELDHLGLVQQDLSHHLQASASIVAPSPQAWSILKASLPKSPPVQSALERIIRSISFPGRISMGGLSLQRSAIILIILISGIFIAPPVWARIEPIIINWFSFSSPNGESDAAIGGFTAFTPYHATYLPEGFQQSLLGSTTSVDPEIESVEIGYDFQEQFIILSQSKGAGVTQLPSGEPSNVSGYVAIFIPSFATSVQEMQDKRPDVPIVTDYSYETTNLLTWFVGDVKIEMFSNLTLEDMLSVAESLKPMHASEGELPEYPE